MTTENMEIVHAPKTATLWTTRDKLTLSHQASFNSDNRTQNETQSVRITLMKEIKDVLTRIVPHICVCARHSFCKAHKFYEDEERSLEDIENLARNQDARVLLGVNPLVRWWSDSLPWQ